MSKDATPWPCLPLPCVRCSVQERGGRWIFWCGRRRLRIAIETQQPATTAQQQARQGQGQLSMFEVRG